MRAIVVEQDARWHVDAARLHQPDRLQHDVARLGLRDEAGTPVASTMRIVVASSCADATTSTRVGNSLRRCAARSCLHAGHVEVDQRESRSCSPASLRSAAKSAAS
jgi:hypothetical protein